jgi:DNA-binding MarR family transcriptional regulator
MDEVRESLSAQAGLLGELLTAAMEPALRRENLSLPLFELLSTIHALRSKGTQAEIARRLGITPPSLSETVRTARNRGLVEQVANKKDGREKLLKLTPAGSKALKQALADVAALEESMVATIPPEELRAAIRALKFANKNLALRLQKAEQ